MQTNTTLPSGNTEHAGSGTAANTVTKAVDSAGAALHSGIDKVADPAREAVDRLSAAAHGTIDKMAESASHTADRFSDQTRRVTEAPGRALACSKSWVQDKPVEAVAAALALGFILGRLTGR